MEKVFDKLAQDADLAEHFQLVSKYPIYPDDAYLSVVQFTGTEI
jgi:hypothetical protein